MIPIRFARSVIIAVISLLVGAASVAAQESSAEISATATVLAPPVAVSSEPLDFGILEAGIPIDIPATPDGGEARGMVRVENVSGNGYLTVQFELPDGLVHTEIPGATLPLAWNDNHAYACIEKTAGGGPDPSGCVEEPWNPTTTQTIARTPRGQPISWVVNVEVFLGGMVVATGDEPAGEYTALIPVYVFFD